jgi:hypothetical protein
VSEQFRPPVGARRQVREHPLAVLDYDLELVALKEARFSPQPLDLAVKLSLVPGFFESMAEAAKEGKKALGRFLAKQAARHQYDEARAWTSLSQLSRR